MRMAIVDIIGSIIKHLALSEDFDDAAIKKKQIESFWDLLFKRFLDTATYVRARVITTISKLLE